MKKFVIVVDMQRDFVARNGALPVPGAEEIIVPMGRWLAGLQPANVGGVLFTADTHVPEVYAGSPEAEQFPPHCVKGTAGWSLVIDPALVDPAIPTYTLEKGVFDMWEEADLNLTCISTAEVADRDAFFTRLRDRGVEEVTVVGVAADYCVRWAVDGLIARGFRVNVLGDLTRGITRSIDAVADAEWGLAPVKVLEAA